MKIADALVGIQRLCIDAAPLIYFVEQNSTYVDRMRSILAKVQAGDIEGFASVITLTEVLTLPLKLKQSSVATQYQVALKHSLHFALLPISAEIAERAAQLRAQYNLKTPDALQVATAIESSCDAFLSNDLGLRRVVEMPILMLDELELDETD